MQDQLIVMLFMLLTAMLLSVVYVLMEHGDHKYVNKVRCFFGRHKWPKSTYRCAHCKAGRKHLKLIKKKLDLSS